MLHLVERCHTISNDTQTLTLTDFLLARIADDEEWAEVAGHPLDVPHVQPCPGCKPRAVAECEAKRKAIDAAWTDQCQIEGEWGNGQSREQMSAKGDNPEVVEWLATPYADHPDYRNEWKP